MDITNTDCMTVVVGRNASKTGFVMVAHNEDDYIHARIRHFYVPARDWEDGEMLPAEEGFRRIPQLRHTYGYWWSQVRGPEGGLSTSDSFINENGVVIVSDSSCGSHEDADEEVHSTDGIVYELRRALAERSPNAREGLRIGIELVEKYGYASAGRIYTIADNNEAFMLQIVRGHRYIAARIPDDAIAVMPNHYTFHSLHDVPEMWYSEDIVEYAVRRGWYTPAKEGDYSDFDFAKAYQDPRTYKHSDNTLRHKYASQMLLGRKWDEKSEGYPFCVKAARKISVDDLMRVMSSHYEGTGCDVRFGPGLSPHDTPVRRICTGTTVESEIYEFTDEERLITAWTALGRPCEQPYVPLHPLCGNVTEIEDGEFDPFAEAAMHFRPSAGATEYRATPWQSMKNFENLCEFRYVEVIPEVTEFKRRLLARFKKSEAKLRNANLSANEINAADTDNLLYAVKRTQDRFLKRGLENARILDASISSDKAGVFCASVVFTAESPMESTLAFGPGRFETSRYAMPVEGSLKRRGEAWSARFEFASRPLEKDGAGTFEYILGGRNKDGSSFAAMCLMDADENGSAELKG
ncbi:MAG: C69 family dipeptidase [Clostridiales bacterium]|nr:C69 family dipeptidase [Clostridiales bacterium]